MSAASPPVISRVRRLGEHVGTLVRVQGWLTNRRSSGKLQFLQVRDGSGVVQCVLRKGTVSDELFAQLDNLHGIVNGSLPPVLERVTFDWRPNGFTWLFGVNVSDATFEFAATRLREVRRRSETVFRRFIQKRFHDFGAVCSQFHSVNSLVGCVSNPIACAVRCVCAPLPVAGIAPGSVIQDHPRRYDFIFCAALAFI